MHDHTMLRRPRDFSAKINYDGWWRLITGRYITRQRAWKRVWNDSVNFSLVFLLCSILQISSCEHLIKTPTHGNHMLWAQVRCRNTHCSDPEDESHVCILYFGPTKYMTPGCVWLILLHITPTQFSWTQWQNISPRTNLLSLQVKTVYSDIFIFILQHRAHFRPLQTCIIFALNTMQDTLSGEMCQTDICYF